MPKEKKEKMTFALLYLIDVVLTGLFILQKYFEQGIFRSGFYLLLLGVVYLAGSTGVFFLLRRVLQKNVRLEKIYLILVLILGCGYLLFFPPGQLPDESSDYLRTLEISEGHFTSISKGEKGAGRYFSTNIEKVFQKNTSYKETLKKWTLSLNSKKKFYNFANKSLYSFVCYLPQLVGVSLGKIFNAPIMVQMLLGKITNFLLSICLIYFSIKWMPFKKELILFLGLLPMTLQEMASLAPDAMAISTSIALISYVFYLKYSNKDKISKANIFLLTCFVLCLSLCKIVYLPLCAVIFLLPDSKFESKKQKYILLLTLIIIAIVLNLYWLSCSSVYLKSFHSRSNSKEQLAFILKNPIEYIAVLSRTLNEGLFGYFEMMVGSALGCLSVHTPHIFVFVTIYLLLSFILKDLKEKKVLKPFELLFISGIVLATIILIFTSLYMQWSQVRRMTVDGVQGRYFLPLIPYIMVLFTKDKMDKGGMNYQNSYWIVFLIFFNLSSFVAILTQFI